TKNFEKAISRCVGATIALADQDDVWYRHKLRRLERAFLQSRACVAAFSDADLIDENSRLKGVSLWHSFSFDAATQHRFAERGGLSVLVKRPVVTGATMAFRREAFDFVIPIPATQIHDRWISFLLATRGQIELIHE